MHLKEGHPGICKLYSRCRDLYYGISKKIVAETLKECLSCAANEPLKNVAPLEHIISTFPMERIQMDIVDLSIYSSVIQYKFLFFLTFLF